YPDGLLARLAASGVDGVWLQAVLYKLAPFPWDSGLSEGHETRLASLRKLCRRARKHGIGVYMYLNEPRSMPTEFFEGHPELLGIAEGGYGTLCTSLPEVRDYVRDGIAHVCGEVPELRGWFSITASENLTSCWSHHRGANCPRCKEREPAEVIAEINGVFLEGIRQAQSDAELICWDWGWRDDWAPAAIEALPDGVSFQSVSEWSIPIKRGGVDSVVGEYSISEVGPGPRATRHWRIARERGLKTIAKIQAGCTWELSAVPYIPAVANVAQHAANLRDAGVEGLMAGWTLGGYPSPNLDVVAEMGRGEPTVDEAMLAVAERRFGRALAPHVVDAWRGFSTAFSEFPFHIGLVYSGPQQMGPANLLYGSPTGYNATMVGIPYDDLNRWRAVYPPDVFIGQFEKVAQGFDSAVRELRRAGRGLESSHVEKQALADEITVASACTLHFRSVADQARFIVARDALAGAATAEEAGALIAELAVLLEREIDSARALCALQAGDSRIGYEASNQYYYVSVDLAEKVLSCRDLLGRWLPAQREKWD
ncbi:MAG TPA: hypothetical protein QGH10_02900, partial [Armatimonadota bacterium]|nr:hypothetical protein [Armatimonadota bacterium]